MNMTHLDLEQIIKEYIKNGFSGIDLYKYVAI